MKKKRIIKSFILCICASFLVACGGEANEISKENISKIDISTFPVDRNIDKIITHNENIVSIVDCLNSLKGTKVDLKTSEVNGERMSILIKYENGDTIAYIFYSGNLMYNPDDESIYELSEEEHTLLYDTITKENYTSKKAKEINNSSDIDAPTPQEKIDAYFDTFETDKPKFGEETGFEVKLSDGHHRNVIEFFREIMTLDNYIVGNEVTSSDAYLVTVKDLYKDRFSSLGIEDYRENDYPFLYFRLMKTYSVESITNIEIIKESEEYYEDEMGYTENFINVYTLKYTLNFGDSSLDMVDIYTFYVATTDTIIDGKSLLIDRMYIEEYDSSLHTSFDRKQRYWENKVGEQGS